MSKDAVNKAVAAAVKLAKDDAAKQIKLAKDEAIATREAERHVRPWVGDLAMDHDSAIAVYQTALGALNIDTKDVPPSVGAYKAILAHIPQPGKNRQAQDTVIAADAAMSDDFAKQFPSVARIKRV
jgi:hypothetical protein